MITVKGLLCSSTRDQQSKRAEPRVRDSIKAQNDALLTSAQEDSPVIARQSFVCD